MATNKIFIPGFGAVDPKPDQPIIIQTLNDMQMLALAAAFVWRPGDEIDTAVDRGINIVAETIVRAQEGYFDDACNRRRAIVQALKAASGQRT